MVVVAHSGKAVHSNINCELFGVGLGDVCVSLFYFITHYDTTILQIILYFGSRLENRMIVKCGMVPII